MKGWQGTDKRKRVITQVRVCDKRDVWQIADRRATKGQGGVIYEVNNMHSSCCAKLFLDPNAKILPFKVVILCNTWHTQTDFEFRAPVTSELHLSLWKVEQSRSSQSHKTWISPWKSEFTMELQVCVILNCLSAKLDDLRSLWPLSEQYCTLRTVSWKSVL